MDLPEPHEPDFTQRSFSLYNLSLNITAKTWEISSNVNPSLHITLSKLSSSKDCIFISTRHWACITCYSNRTSSPKRSVIFILWIHSTMTTSTFVITVPHKKKRQPLCHKKVWVSKYHFIKTLPKEFLWFVFNLKTLKGFWRHLSATPKKGPFSTRSLLLRKGEIDSFFFNKLSLCRDEALVRKDFVEQVRSICRPGPSSDC